MIIKNCTLQLRRNFENIWKILRHDSPLQRQMWVESKMIWIVVLMKGFMFFPYSEGYSTKPVLQSSVVIFCKLQTKPWLGKKLFSSGECNVEWGIQTSPVYCAVLMSPDCLSSFKSSTEGVVDLFSVSPCMSGLLRSHWLGLGRLLSTGDKHTLSYLLFIFIQVYPSLILSFPSLFLTWIQTKSFSNYIILTDLYFLY